MQERLKVLNSWAARWGALIALVGTVAGVLALVVPSGNAPSGKSKALPAPTVPVRPEPALETGTISTSAGTAWAAHEIGEAGRHRRDRDVIANQIRCEQLLQANRYNGLDSDHKQLVVSTCLSSTLEHAYVRHFDRLASGTEEQLVTAAKALTSRLVLDPVFSSDYRAVCGSGDEADFRDVVQFSWFSIALKAYWLASTFGQADKVLESLDRGSSPLDALPELPLMDGLSNVDYLTRSYRVLTTYQIDRLLHRYPDEVILSWAERLTALLPESVQVRLHRVVALYLDTYRSTIKPKSADVARLYRESVASANLVKLDAGRLIGNFPSDTLFASCVSPHIARFWLRRITNGTDARFEALASEYVRRKAHVDRNR